MHEKQTRHAPGAWVRGTVLALFIIAVVAALAWTGPKVLEAEHRWMVEQCPIAYVGEDGRIHWTNERGTLDVELDGPTVYVGHWDLESRPAWSPSGQLIAYTHLDGDDLFNALNRRIAVLEPATRRWWQLPRTFGGWLRREVLLQAGDEFLDARTGEVVQKQDPHDRIDSIAPINAHAEEGWVVVGSYGGGGGHGVQFRDEDMNFRMPIWTSLGDAVGPRVDPTGTWAGWTSGGRAMVKAMSETAATPARQIGGPKSTFCDWTDDGHALVNSFAIGRWSFVILDTSGRFVRELPTDVPPMQGSAASWRRAMPREDQ